VGEKKRWGGQQPRRPGERSPSVSETQWTPQMHQTNNDFGQALAPWSDRWEAARRIRAMRQRILGTEHKEADDGEGGGNDEKGKSARAAVEVTTSSLESKSESKPAAALIRRVSPRTGANIKTAPAAKRGSDGTTDGDRQKRLRPGEDIAGGSDSIVLKKQRAESAAATADGERGTVAWASAFHETAVLVIHKNITCKCSECSALEVQLKQLKAFCPRTQMLNEKERSAAKSTLPFLQEGSTFVAVHHDARQVDVLSFLALHKQEQLGEVSLRRFDWVRDSAARNQLLADAKYTWTEARQQSPRPQPVAAPVRFEAAGAAGGGAGAVAAGGVRGGDSKGGGGLGLNLRPSNLRFGRGTAGVAAGGAAEGGKRAGKEAVEVDELRGAESDNDFIDLIEDENEENGWSCACSDSDRSLAFVFIAAHVRAQIASCHVV